MKNSIQNIDYNTGIGLCWYQGNTSNVLTLNDTLTALPSSVEIEIPYIVQQEEEKAVIRIAPENTALAFYLLMQAGEVKCYRDNRFEVDKKSLDVLLSYSIPYEVIR